MSARWLLCLSMLGGLAEAEPMPRPVVVELFTSEGCSSCPRGEEIFDALVKQSPPGVVLIPLAFHVDYWNDLGWADPFSRPEFTARQSSYARSTGGNNVYTPQMVIDGSDSFVPELRHAAEVIAGSRTRPSATVHFQSSKDGLEISVSNLPADEQDAELWLARTESGVTSHVPRGENGGRTLVHNGLVRSLTRVTARRSGSVLAATLRREGSRPKTGQQAILLVQSVRSRKMLSAAQIPL